MKKLNFSILMMCAVLTVTAQSKFTLQEGEPTVVYSLPKTELCFELEVETVAEKPGVFYQYSQRYLATDKVVFEHKTTTKVVDVQLKTKAIPDPNRRYAVSVSTKTSNSVIVNEQGILCGVNVDVPEAQTSIEKRKTNIAGNDNQESLDLLPLTQEYMMAGSIAKMAEGAAIQIYNIRMSRLNLLSGDVDYMPDGQALKLMLDELDKKEKELTELFIGTIRKEVKTYTVYYTPDYALSNDILFRLSAKRGIVPNDDLSGTPYYISVKPENISTTKTTDSKTKEEAVGLYTVLPAETDITLTDGVNVLYQEKLQLPQFGKLIPLPEFVTQKSKVKIVVDPQTGRLMGVK